MDPIPSFLFAALSEFDADTLRSGGLMVRGGTVLLFSSIEQAEAALLPLEACCIVMVHVQQMVEDGFTFTESGENVWSASVVPPKYLWVSSRGS